MITKEQVLRIKTLSIAIIDDLFLVSQSIGIQFRNHCKVHHLTHYADLIERFGPLYLFSTFRFERKHQFSKNISRKVKNTKNLSYTLHTRHQIQRAFEDQQLSFSDLDFFPPEPERTIWLMNPPSDNLVKLNSKLHPFRLNKGVIRKSVSGRNEWIYATAFYKDEDNVVWCKGRQCTFFYQRENLTPVRHSVNGLQQLRILSAYKFARLDHFKLSNDFIFSYERKHWLLEWI